MTTWKKRPTEIAVDENRIREMAKECDTYPVLIQVLLNRGYNENDIIGIMTDPVSLIPQAPLNGSIPVAEIIIKHLKSNSNIYVFADYDCDGLTSGYVMANGLREIRNALKSTSKIMLHYPERTEGYGLSMNFCEKVVGKAKLVITVDNGITKYNEVQFLKSHGCDVVITDHHEAVEGLVPDTAICNPCFNDIDRGHLAGVGVAWNVIKMTDSLSGAKIDTQKYISAVAVGTVADVMPLTPENVALIEIGLQQMNKGKALPFFNFYKAYETSLDFTAKDIGWNLGPKLNAAGRMGNVWLGAAGLFALEDDEMRQVLKDLNSMNSERKELTDEFKEKVKEIDILDARIATYNGSETRKGVHGILAGELAKQFPMYPAFVYSEQNGILHGSIRCNNKNIDLMEMFLHQKNKGNLISVGGHKFACVISLKKDRLDDFINSFSDEFDSLDLKTEEESCYYDTLISLSSANTALLTQLNRIPTDRNTQPVFVLPNALVISTNISNKNPKNICFKLSDNTSTKEVWAWGFSEKYKELGSPKQLHILCSIEQDFRHKTSARASLKVIDILPAETA